MYVLPRLSSNNSSEQYSQIFDFMNVQFIHDPIFRSHLPEPVLEHARDLANFHEHGVFTSPQLGGIGNSELLSSSYCKSALTTEDSCWPNHFAVYLGGIK